MSALIGSRTALSIADQAVSSLGNVALTIVVASSVSSYAFGQYVLVLAVYQIVLVAGQALIGEPLLVVSGDPDRLDRRHVERGALGAGLLLGTAVLAILGIAAVVVDLPAALVGLALLMPGLLLQDALRYVAFSRRSPGWALLSDTCWTGIQLALTAAVLARGDAAVWTLVVAWGAPAYLAAVVIAIPLRTGPDPRRARAFLRRTRHLGGRFALESAAAMGAFQLAVLITAGLAGLVDAGRLRLVQTLFGPLHVLVAGGRAAMLPEVVERLRTGRSPGPAVWRFLVLFSAAAVAWSVLLLLIPDSVGRSWLGPAWSAFGTLVVLTGVQKVIESAGTAPYLVHRAKERAAWTLHVRLVALVAVCAATAAVTPVWGATGAAVVLIGGSLLPAGASWIRYLREDVPGRTAVPAPSYAGGLP